jgi:hypothetical protein
VTASDPVVKAPIVIIATPDSNAASTIDSLREYRSTMTPVGSSKRKYATSSAVPASTSCKGDIPIWRTK